MSTLREQIEAELRTARRSGDERTKNVIGMLKNMVLTELKSGKGVEETDALWQQVIGAYAKQVRKSIPEFEKAGDRGLEALEEARFELAFCERFLPKKLSEEDTRKLVREIVEREGLSGPKDLGRLMGLVMKDHKDQVDGAVVRRIAQELLAG
ncbi:MAG: hypothetical protein D6705_18345 [Deltaproteobacteria bacterium]|nr:MAG: hypothetical protein D6705_18345 [Deltaproteobacteria bacterium]